MTAKATTTTAGDAAVEHEGPIEVRRTVRDGDWNDPDTWEGGRVPDGAEDWVVVAHRVTGRPADRRPGAG
jgi:hypothetical protein